MPKFEAGMESMLDMFVFETGDLLEKLDDILMRTEQEETIGTEDINEIFRTMHTIKGSAAMMGLQNMSALAHAVEDLFYIIRDDPEVKYDKPGLYELLFTSSDNLKSELDNIQDDDIPLTDFTELEGKIHAFAAQMKGESAPEQSGAQASGGDDISQFFPDDEDESILTYRVTYQESCAMPSARGFVLLRNLGQIAEVCSTVPVDLDDDNADDEIKAHGLIIKLITDDPKKVLEYLEDGINVEKAEQLKKPDKSAAAPAPAPKPAEAAAPTPQEAEKAVEQAKEEAPKPAKQAPKKPAEKHEQSLITVNLEKLNQLLDLVAEIVITQGSVTSSPDLKDLGVDLDRFNIAYLFGAEPLAFAVVPLGPCGQVGIDLFPGRCYRKLYGNCLTRLNGVTYLACLAVCSAGYALPTSGSEYTEFKVIDWATGGVGECYKDILCCPGRESLQHVGLVNLVRCAYAQHGDIISCRNDICLKFLIGLDARECAGGGHGTLVECTR